MCNNECNSLAQNPVPLLDGTAAPVELPRGFGNVADKDPLSCMGIGWLTRLAADAGDWPREAQGKTLKGEKGLYSTMIGGGRTNQTSLPKSCQYPTNRRRVPYTNPSYIVPTSLFTLNDKHKKIKSARIFSEYEHRRRRDQRASSYSSVWSFLSRPKMIKFISKSIGKSIYIIKELDFLAWKKEFSPFTVTT